MIWLVLVSAGVSCSVTWVVRRAASHWQVFDRKTAPHRTPLLGGVAIYLTTVALVSFMLPVLVQGYLLPKHVFGILVAGSILMLGGILDDLKNLGMELTILEKEIDILQKRMKDISHKKKISDTLSKISKLN